MPKNKVSDLITDREIVFARLILSGTMTDQQAAEAAGLNPNTAAYIKSTPRVRAYMLEHRALMQQQAVEQETESLRRLNLGREQVLARLWQIANLDPEMTRGSITGQVRALSMIVAIEGLIPDRRAGSAKTRPAPPITEPQIYASAWLGEQQEKTTSPQADPAFNQNDQEDQEGDGPPVPEADHAPGSAAVAPPDYDPIFDPAASTFASKTQSPHAAFAPDTRVPFSIAKNRFARRR
jgi:hypothetical protein